MSGLSTTGSISLGLALVAGRKRVPRPATGNTAVRITDFGVILIGSLLDIMPSCRQVYRFLAQRRLGKTALRDFSIAACAIGMPRSRNQALLALLRPLEDRGPHAVPGAAF